MESLAAAQAPIGLEINLPSGTPMAVDLDGAASIGDVRGSVALACGLSADQVRLTGAEGQILDDTVLLASLMPDAVLTAVLKTGLSGVVTIRQSMDLDTFISSFTHPDKELVEWRRRCPIYCGDLDLEMVALPREHTSWEEFFQVHASDSMPCEEYNDYERDPKQLLGQRPADVLWDFANFGTLLWDWAYASELPWTGPVCHCTGARVTLDAATGERFMPRVWECVDPDADAHEVREAGVRALAALEAMPAAITGGIPKNEMAERMKADMDLLEALVEKRGSFGAAALPDALIPIVAACRYCHDGNTAIAIFATEYYCFWIKRMTS